MGGRGGRGGGAHGPLAPYSAVPLLLCISFIKFSDTGKLGLVMVFYELTNEYNNKNIIFKKISVGTLDCSDIQHL